MLRTLCLALGFLLSTPLLATPIAVFNQSEQGLLSLNGSDVFDVKICREQYVDRACVVKVTAVDNAKKVVIAIRNQHTGLLKIISKADIGSFWSSRLVFKNVGTVSLVFMLVDKSGDVVATAGITLDIKPAGMKLDQDQRTIFDFLNESSDDNSQPREYYYTDPPPTYEE